MADSICQDSVNDFPLIAPFDPTKKKKKKQKSKVVICHHTDDSVHRFMNRIGVLSLCEQARDGYPVLMTTSRAVSTNINNAPSDFIINDADGLREDPDVDDEEEGGAVPQSKYPWEGSERDYNYKELLKRLFSFVHKNNPGAAGNRQRTVLRPPQILFDGIAQTAIVNFTDLCKTMHRSPEHLKAYILKEIGTFGSLDGENRLVLKGRHTSTNLEDLLQSYINKYVLCNCCRSPDTILAKEKHSVLLQCDMCGSERSVPPVDILIVLL